MGGGGGGKSFRHAERGGGGTFWCSFLRKLEVLAILKRGGGATKFHPLKGGGEAQIHLPYL